MARGRIALAACIAASAGCSLFLGLDPLGYDPPATTDLDAATDLDGAVSSSSSPDAPIAPNDGEASFDAGPPFDDPSRWTSYDGLKGGWYAGTYDGRFVYFIRAGASEVARYDTQLEDAFGQASSWSTVALSAVSAQLETTYAITFDGRYIVVANYTAPDAALDGTFVRYDTQSAQPFDQPSSWESFDGNVISAAASRFVSAVTYADASIFGTSSYNRPFFRRPPGGDLDSGWETFVPPVDAAACNRNNFGAACVGDYVYFGPGSASVAGDCILRYDVTKPFDAGSSWDCFSLGQIDRDVTGMQGTASDGKYIYVTELGPGLGDAADLPRRIGRHVSSASLDAGWEFRLTTKTNPLLTKYFGGTFDGRFMYFAPSSDNGVTFYLRYDTLLPFDDDAAWTAVPSSKVLLLDANHAGAIFDGKYVYYPPASGRAVRYRARDDRAYVSSCSGF